MENTLESLIIKKKISKIMQQNNIKNIHEIFHK